MKRAVEARKLIDDALTNNTKECVLWQYAKAAGYASFSLKGAVVRGHRLACEIAHGPPPFEKAEAAHKCGNRSCINPNHLYWATRKENEADKVLHGTDQRGERNGSVKFSDLTILEIRELYANGETQRSLATKFGVSVVMIGCIVRNQRRATANGPTATAKLGERSRGERHGIAKMNAVKVVEMRKLRENGATFAELAELYGISKPTAHKICRRQAWAHIL